MCRDSILLFLLIISITFLTLSELVHFIVGIVYLSKYYNNDNNNNNTIIFTFITVFLNAYTFSIKLFLLFKNLYFNCPSTFFFKHKILFLYIPILLSQSFFITIYIKSNYFFIDKDAFVLTIIWQICIFLYDLRISYLAVQNLNNQVFPSRINDDDNEEEEKKEEEKDFLEINLTEEQDCCICLEPMQTGVKLECNHILHKECIRKWHTIKKSCPLCRNKEINNIQITVQ